MILAADTQARNAGLAAPATWRATVVAVMPGASWVVTVGAGVEAGAGAAGFARIVVVSAAAVASRA